MGTVDDYLADLDAADRTVIADAYAAVTRILPDAEQGRAYGMPALRYRDKALISIMQTRKHIGVYPYSGLVPARVAASFPGLAFEKGTVRFPSREPVPTDVLEALVRARIAEIDDPALRRPVSPPAVNP